MSLSLLFAAALTAQIASGPIAGETTGTVNVFRGIPYAAAPVGTLRWKPTQPVAPWTEVRDATKPGAACPQPDDKWYGMTPAVQNEDCLFLNVTAPVNAKDLPVMVWIHGGSNRMGAGTLPLYDASKLAARGLVVVTINYRLGYLGFFAHDAIAAEGAGGNFALQDQVAALKWVQQNISAFGGDAKRVTVFGESAGGGDILYLMASPLAKGLFSAAIVQSGGGWHKPRTPEKAKKAVMKDFEKAGITAADAASLRAIDARKFVDAQTSAIGFGAWLDGLTVTEAPWKAAEEGRTMQIPLMIGSNSWEGSLSRATGGFGWKGKMLSFMPSVYGWYDSAKDSAERQEMLFRDAAFEAPARWIAQKAKAPTFLYRYGHVTAGRKGTVPGAGHAAELAYVFETLDLMKKNGPSEADYKFSTQMADCWASFGKDPLKPACGGADWKPYDASADNVLWIEDDFRQVKHPNGEILDGVYEKFGPTSFFGG